MDRADREAQEQAAADVGSSGYTEAVAGVASAAREFERRTLRFNDVRRSVWVAFTKDDYALAKSAPREPRLSRDAATRGQFGGAG